MANLEKIVNDAIASFSLELVEIERAPRGLLRVFIDRPEGKGFVTVEDCSKVSNQLSHALTVENIEYERLEVSSPGLDRVLKTSNDFLRFKGLPVRVRLTGIVDNRKRFDGVVVEVAGDEVTFRVTEGESSAGHSTKGRKRPSSGKQEAEVGDSEKLLRVTLGQIERARLIPQI